MHHQYVLQCSRLHVANKPKVIIVESRVPFGLSFTGHIFIF